MFFFRATVSMLESLRFVFVVDWPSHKQDKGGGNIGTADKVPRLKPGPPPAGPRCARFFLHAAREPDRPV
jgi:hypothetical protein